MSRTGLVHRDDCTLLEHVVARAPGRAEALRMGVRLARCCADGRIATRSPDSPEAVKGLASWH